MRVRPRVCVSLVYERERERYEGGCMDVWEAVIWCMGVGVKADRMRIVIIYLCRVYSLLIIFECVSYCLFNSAFL